MVENCTHIFFSALDFRNILPYLPKPAPGGSSYSLRSKRKKQC